MRKQVTMGVTFAAGILAILDYFLKTPAITKTEAEVQGWVLLLSGWVLVLATLNLIKMHLVKAQQRKSGWEYSIVVLIGTVVMAFAGLGLGKNSEAYRYIFNQIMQPIGNTLFALMIFFVTSASYRAFRVRNWQAGVLLVSAAFVLLGGAPAGAVVHAQLPAIRDWFLNIPNVAGNRAIILSSAVGMLALGVKILLGLERGHLGGGE